MVLFIFFGVSGCVGSGGSPLFGNWRRKLYILCCSNASTNLIRAMHL